MTAVVLLVLIVLTALLTAGLAAYAWRHRQVQGARAYAVLALAECLLSLAEILSMISPTPEAALAWFRLRYTAIAAVSVCWVIFVLGYSSRRESLPTWLIAALLVIPVATQAMLWTNHQFGLWATREISFQSYGRLWVSDPFSRIPGPGFLVHSFYNLTLSLAGVILLLVTGWRLRRRFLGQALLLAGAGLTAFGFGANSIFNLIPTGGMNLFTPGIGLSVVLIALAAFRFDFLRQSPAGAPGLENRLLEPRQQRVLASYLLVFAAMVAGLLAVGYQSYQAFAREHQAEAENQLRAVARLKADGLARWRAERLGDGQVLRRNAALAALVEGVLSDPRNEASRADLGAWLDSLRAAYGYERVFLLDSDGVERFASPESVEPAAVHLRSDIEAVLASGDPALVDFHRDVGGGPVRLAVLVPLYDPVAGGPLGVLVLRIDPQTYLYPFLAEWPAASETAETLLVRREGNAALFLNPVRFRPEAALSLRIPLADADELSAKAVLGETGVVEGIDYRGEPVIGDVRAIPDSPWFLVARMDIAEVHAPLRARLWQTAVLLGALVIASGSALGMVWRQQQLGYYRARFESIEALRASEARFQNLADIAPVGIFRTDEHGRTLYANRYWSEVSGLPPEHALGEGWLEAVHPEDRPGLSTGWERAVGEQSVSQAEYRFLRPDGSVAWVIGRSIPEVSSDGRVRGYIGTITEVSERRQAEALVQARNRELAFLNQAATRLTALGTGQELYTFLAQTLREFTQAAAATCGIYDPVRQELAVRHAELEPGIVRDLVRALGGKRLTETTFPIGPEIRDLLVREPVSFRRSLSEATFGVVPPALGRVVQRSQGIDRFVGIAYVVEGTLYGASLLAFHKGQPDPSLEVLASFGHLAALAVRRMQAEHLLRESEQRFRATFDQAAVGIAHVSPEGRFLRLNQRFCDIVGFTQEEMRARSFQDITHPDDLEADRNLIRRVLAGELQTYSMEKRYLRKGGAQVWINLTVSLVRRPDGEPAYFISVVEDISEQKRAQEEAARSRALLQSVTDNSTALIYSMDLEGRFLLINRRLEAVLGVPREELIGKPREACLPAEVAAAHRANDLQVIRERRAIVAEEENDEADGKHTYLSAKFPLFDSQGKLEGVGGISTDITEHKRAEAALHYHEELLRDVGRVARIGGWEFDPETGKGSWTEEVAHIHEVDPAQETDVAYGLSFYLGESRERMEQALRQAIELGRPFDVELELTTRTGARKWVQSIGRPVTVDGRVVRVRGSFQDISERKQAETELLRANRMYALISQVNQAIVRIRGREELLAEVCRVSVEYGGFRMAWIGMIDEQDQVVHPVAWHGAEEGYLSAIEDISTRDLPAGRGPTGTAVREDRSIWSNDIATDPRMAPWREEALRRGYRSSIGLPVRLLGRAIGVFNLYSDEPSFFTQAEIQLLEEVAADIGYALETIDAEDKRQRAVDDLRRSEVRYRELFEANPHCMWVYDLETLAFLAVNDAAVAHYGYSRDEFLKMTIKDIRPEEDVSRLLADVAATSDALNLAGVWRHRRKDGTLIEVEIRSHSLAYGGRPARMVLALDVTERLRAEAATRLAYDRLRRFRDSNIVGVVIASPDGKVLEANDYYLQTIGYTRQEFEQGLVDWRAVTPPEWLPADEDAIAELRQRGVCTPYEKEYQRRDGSRVSVFVSDAMLPGPEEQIAAFVLDITERKRAEQALRTSEALFSDAFHAGPAGMTITRISDGNFIDVNNAFLTMFEFTRDQVVGRMSTELQMWSPESRAEVIARQVAAGGLTGAELRARTRSGKAIDIVFSSRPIELRGEACLVTTMIDITERKRAEAALRESESALNKAQHVAHVGSWAWHIPENRLEWSDEMYRIFGIEKEAFTGNLADVIGQAVHPDDRPAVEAANLSVARDGKPVPLEYRVILPDGTIRTVWAEAGELIRDQAGQPSLLTGIVQDITEPRKTELERQKFFMLAESSSEFIGMCDLEMRLIYVNPAGVRMVGLSDMDAACRVKVQDYFFPEDRAFITDEFFPRVLREGRGEVEIRLRHFRTGEPLWFSYSLFGVHAASGQAIGWATVSRDITERRRAEEEIRALNAELDQRVIERTAQLEVVNRELESFAYSVSHDLRGPLRALDGFSAALLRDQPERLDETGRHYLERIGAASRRMSDLIDALLMLSRISRRELKRERVDLTAIAREAAAELQAQDPGRKAEWVISGGLAIDGDAHLLRIVMGNLLANAWKFTAPRVPARIEVGALPGTPTTYFVRDNGVGFDMTYADKLFSPFQRLHTTLEFPGTGIGLATVQRIITRHGGRIWAEARVDQGAIFYFNPGGAA